MKRGESQVKAEALHAPEQGLADQAYQAIKTNILNLSYAPGSALSEAGLAEELGLGRMPVRLAIKKLKAEGWLTAAFRCQTRVKDITAQDVAEVYQIRRLLEEQALREIFAQERTWEYSFRLEEKLLRIKAVRDDLYARECAESAWHAEMLTVFANERLRRMYEAIQEDSVRIALSYVRQEGYQEHYVNTIIAGLERLILELREQHFEEARAILERDHWQGGEHLAQATLAEQDENS